MKKIEDILNSERIWGHTIVFPVHSAWIKLPDCGTCSVIWSENEDGMEHVSVSPKKKFRVPTWDDIQKSMKIQEINGKHGMYAEKIAALRRNSKITMMKMSQIARCSPAEYSAYEHERKPFDPEVYKKCKAYVRREMG